MKKHIAIEFRNRPRGDDEFSLARRAMLEKQFWQWHRERDFKALCEGEDDIPLIADSDRPGRED